MGIYELFEVTDSIKDLIRTNPSIQLIKEEARIKVNGETVLPSKDGTFEATIMLERGLNIIAVEGKKRYSRPATIYRMVVFDPPAGDRAALSLYE